MPAITINVTDEVAAALKELAQRCTEAHRAREGATTHGELTVRKLLEMLAEDAAMVVTRPGAWEADGIASTIQKHGYF